MASSTAPRPVPRIGETLVAGLWERQGPFRLPLATADGEGLQVVYPGRRRWDRGPDFTGAMIAWPGARLVHGDVEVHVRSSDWRLHGHHRDPHFNTTVLHVVMWDDAPGSTRRRDGVPVPVLDLARHLALPLEMLASPSFPYPPPPSPCWPGWAEDPGPLAALLEECGSLRLQEKVDRFREMLGILPPDQLLYESAAEALGYSENREPMRRLAAELPLALLQGYLQSDLGGGDPASLEALLFGVSGLLPFQRSAGPSPEDPYGRLLEACWADHPVEAVRDREEAFPWRFFRVRPANFPSRRVAALAGLARRWPEGGMAPLLADLARVCPPKALCRALEGLVMDQGPPGYWQLHWDFGQVLGRPRALVGRQRAAEVAVNVFLPFLIAWAGLSGDGELEGRVREGYRLYPKRGDNEITRHMATQITGRARPPVARLACRQQGLLHLFRAHCEARACRRCPCGSHRPSETPAGLS